MLPRFSAEFRDEFTTVLMSAPDGDEIQSSRNEKRHHPRNSILDSPFVQAGPGGGSGFTGVGFGRLPKTGGGGDAHLP